MHFCHKSGHHIRSVCCVDKSHQATSLSPHHWLNSPPPTFLWARQTDLRHPDEVGDYNSSLWGGGLAQHHELDPLGNAVEKRDETLQDGIVYCAAVHHKAVVVLKLKQRKRTLKATGVEL